MAKGEKTAVHQDASQPKTRSAVAKKTGKKAPGRTREVKKTPAKNTSVRKTTRKATTERARSVAITDRTGREPLIKGGRKNGLDVGNVKTPVRTNNRLAQIARISGLVFVVCGTFFALINMNLFAQAPFSENAHTQYSATFCSGTNLTYCSSMSSSSVSSASGSFFDSGFEEPDVHFNVSGSADALSGTVDINYTVPNARSLIAMVFDQSTDSYRVLGPASHIAGDQWRYRWNTANFHDGKYRLRAIIQADMHSYDDIADFSVTVANGGGIDTTTDASSTGSTATINPTGPQASADVTVTDATTSQQTPSDTTQPHADITAQTVSQNMGRTLVLVEVPHAESVEIFLHAEGVPDAQLLGDATYIGNDKWQLITDSDTDIFDTHTIHARITNQYGTYESGKKTVSLDSETVGISDPSRTDIQFEPIRINEISDPIRTLIPDISLSLRSGDMLSETEHIVITVEGARFVEVYATPNFGLTPRFLGLARKLSSNQWQFSFDTSQTPNGTYEVFARVRNEFGFYESDPVFVTIKNIRRSVQTMEESAYVQRVRDTGQEIATDTIKAIERTTTTQKSLFEQAGITTQEEQKKVSEILETFRNRTEKKMYDYAEALRTNNTEQIRTREESITELMDDARTEFTQLELTDSARTVLDEHIREVSSALKQRTRKNEELIAERVGEAVFTDSDNDGISDYDEINLYETDPFGADTDADGFVDGAEVTNGYDPRDSTPEVLVEYESPQETGIERTDILTVESITTITPDPEDSASDGVRPTAVITGRALPNSYVTLYIFSTPIVVTVKTGDDGSWSYTFDKELPNGEHEVYAAVTDNAGRIVAKSSALSFVKTAEAYTPTDPAAATRSEPLDSAGPAILSQNMILGVTSISVVLLGLVLLLIGLYAREPHTNAPV